MSAELLLDSMAEGVQVLSPDLRIILWNPAMTEITGYSLQEALGKPIAWLSATGCHNRDIFKQMVTSDTYISPCINGCECKFMNKQGHIVQVLINARVLKNSDGEILGLLQTVTDISNVCVLREEIVSLRSDAITKGRFKHIIGNSQVMHRLTKLISLAAESTATVLIQGESGTGKEIVAATIHKYGERADKPFIKINCGALTETLLESELFGHEKGAFTGAVKTRIGRFEAADGGTIFLDEIGEISLAMQVKLLRVLQEGEFERVGATKSHKVDVRVIAATNRDLKQALLSKQFRSDLYYRLKVFPIEVPALRNRKDDIPYLIDHFIKLFNEKTGKSIANINPQALDICCQYSWPGNVRELENSLEYCFVVCRESEITIEHLPPDLVKAVTEQKIAEYDDISVSNIPGRGYKSIVTNKKRLEQLLHECNWNKAEVARKIGISRTAIWKWMKKHQIPLQLDV